MPEVAEDHVAIVSRNADGSDAQPNKTVRILDAEASAEADDAQLAPVLEPDVAVEPELDVTDVEPEDEDADE